MEFALWDAGVLGLLFWPLYCWIGGWGLVIWLNARLLVVNYLLRTCILFTCTCTATTTGHLTWGVVFWLSLHVITLPNLGCVGYMVKACTVLRLHWLVVNYLLSCGRLVVFVGLWHNFCILSWLVWLKECRDRRKDTLILQEIVEVVQICLKYLPYSRLPELVFKFRRLLQSLGMLICLADFVWNWRYFVSVAFVKILWAQVICLELSCSRSSSCNLVRVNSTQIVLPYCLVLVKFCDFLNLSRSCA